MATLNLRVGDGSKLLDAFRVSPHAVQRFIDAKKNPFTQAGSDPVQLIDVPAKTFVDFVVTDVQRVEGSAGNTDTGDAADPDGYGVDTNVNALGSICSRGGALTEGTPNVYAPAYGGGKYYTAAGVISLVPSISLANAKIQATAVMYPFG